LTVRRENPRNDRQQKNKANLTLDSIFYVDNRANQQQNWMNPYSDQSVADEFNKQEFSLAFHMI